MLFLKSKESGGSALKNKPLKFCLDALRNFISAIWIVLFTLIYGTLIFIVRPFSKEGSRIVSVWWCKNIAFLTGVKAVLHGLEKLDKSSHYVFLANHSSYYDIVALYISLPYKLSFIAKKSLFSIPIWGWALSLVGHIPLDRENPQKARLSMDKAIAKINNEKRSIFAFPEGSRSRTGQINEFKLGIFTLALKAGVDIVPIAIRGARDAMRKGTFFVRSGIIDVHILDPIPVKGIGSTDKYALAQKTRDAIIDCCTNFNCP
jgi:1-acyl-sn-glycerol-3-phosphate acyltransferase